MIWQSNCKSNYENTPSMSCQIMSSIGHILEFETMGDERGSPLSNGNECIICCKVRFIFGTKPDISGVHAHKDLEQIAICVGQV